MINHIKDPWRYYLGTIPIALLCFWSFATIHGYLAYGYIHLASYVMPTLVALTIGTLMGYLLKLRRELHITSEQFRAIVDQAQEFVYLRDLDGTFEYVSPSSLAITGYAPQSFYSRPDLMDDLIHPEDRVIWHEHVKRVNEGGRAESLDVRVLTRSGELRWVNHISRPVYDDQGQLKSIRSTSMDITERKLNENKLRQAATIFMQVNEGVVITDANIKILTVNQAFCDISGYKKDELIGESPAIWRSDYQDEGFYQNLWGMLSETRRWRGEVMNRRKNGDLYPAWLTISAVHDDQGEVVNYVSIISDISSLKQSQERVEYLAHHDLLTDLPNRLLFNDRLEHALQRAVRHKTMVAVLFLDLDNFKAINDGLGHPIGDKVLRFAASRLHRLVREEDTVARIAGDEFSIILEDIVNTEDVATLADKIIDAYRSPFYIDNHELHVTVSVGISIAPDDGLDVTTLVKNADAAMYQAKERGKADYCFYTEELTVKALDRLKIENHLRKALINDELELYYQPQYELETGRLIGAEVLLRWLNHALGRVPPDRFIPLAESTGLILPIGEWVLTEACRQAKQWSDLGLDVGRISVNVAGQQVRHGHIVSVVKQALQETGLDSSMLELEITESFIMQQTEQAISTLAELRELDIALSIDDFGTGYSSLSYLKQLPINKLKIDRSFVRDIPTDKDSEAIVSAVIALGKSLNLEVIAEGVETESQCEFLRSRSCDEVQGYFFNRPMPTNEFTEVLKTYNKQEQVVH